MIFTKRSSGKFKRYPNVKIKRRFNTEKIAAGSGTFRGAKSNVINNELPATYLVVSDEFGQLNVSNYSASTLENINFAPNTITVSNNTGLLQALAVDRDLFKLSR